MQNVRVVKTNMDSVKCSKCQKEISWLRIAKSWPTNIKCKACTSRHYYRYGHIVGVLYLVILLPPMLLPLIYSGNFANVENGIHSLSALQAVVQFGGMFIIFLVVGFVYATIMRRYLTLYAR